MNEALVYHTIIENIDSYESMYHLIIVDNLFSYHYISNIDNIIT